MTNPLPPLGLDDIRAAGPDRDSAEAFDPNETWYAACNAIEYGHTADTVAAILLELKEGELERLRNWWVDEVREGASHGATREADCPDVLLLAALNAQDVRFWRLPMISGASVVLLRWERDRLRAALGDVLALTGDDDGATVAVAIPHDLLARIRAALGEA